MHLKNLDLQLLKAIAGLNSASEKVQAFKKLWVPKKFIPLIGGHIYIHPTALCPVGCTHCMYCSLKTSDSKSCLDLTDLQRLKGTLQAINPCKLTFSGGGEPFLVLNNCLDIMNSQHIGKFEYITSGNWAITNSTTRSILAKVYDNKRENQTITIRVSIDSFHWSAQNPVHFQNYVNIINEFSGMFKHNAKFKLAFRSLLREREIIERALSNIPGVDIVRLDKWNSQLIFNGRYLAHITYNVMKFSGFAQLHGIKRCDFDISMEEFYVKYAGLENANVSSILNDESIGKISRIDGASLIFDSNGECFIFGANPPDWKANLEMDFSDINEFINSDPLTHYLFKFGLLGAVDLMRRINPNVADRALSYNDSANLINTLFDDPWERAACRLLALVILTNMEYATLKQNILQNILEPQEAWPSILCKKLVHFMPVH